MFQTLYKFKLEPYLGILISIKNVIEKIIHFVKKVVFSVKLGIFQSTKNLNHGEVYARFGYP